MTRALTAMALSPLVKQQVGFFLSRPDLGDLATLRDFLTDGSITPVIDRTYPLADTAAAFTYLEEGHAGGKVIIAM
jgi:NADPH:quinone reductase-like Zn-dependent oxidoreductase